MSNNTCLALDQRGPTVAVIGRSLVMMLGSGKAPWTLHYPVRVGLCPPLPGELRPSRSWSALTTLFAATTALASAIAVGLAMLASQHGVLAEVMPIESITTCCFAASAITSSSVCFEPSSWPSDNAAELLVPLSSY